MRRKRSSAGCLSSVRSGVTASVMQSSRNVQSPVARINASAGLAPSVAALAPVALSTTPYTNHANGNRQTMKSSGLAAECSNGERRRRAAGALGGRRSTAATGGAVTTPLLKNSS